MAKTVIICSYFLIGNFTDKQRDKSTESATHNTSTNNKENADVNDSEASAAAVANEPAVDFNVYDIAMNENTHVDDQQQADVTIASLMCPIRNRKRTRVAAVKPDSLEAGGKKSSVKSSAEKCENKALSANEACDDVKRRKKSVEFDVPIMFDNCEQSGEGKLLDSVLIYCSIRLIELRANILFLYCVS